MGLIADAATRLKNAIGDLFPEEQPSALPIFPQNASSPSIEPAITIRKSAMDKPTINPESSPLGKITSYNWKGDPYTDTNSRNMVGSFGKLTPQGLAVSPDIEKQFKEQGIKPKDRVEIILADGTNMIRTWEDRTMQDKQAIRKYGKPLTGRFDLNFPEGTKPHEKDGVAVVGFRKISQSQ